MFSKKLLLLICLSLVNLKLSNGNFTTLNVTQEHSSKWPGFVHHQLYPEPGHHHSWNTSPSEHNQCICSQKEKPSVLNSLRPGNVKRLVVFFYQYEDSPDTFAYVPNKRKQKEIPNLNWDPNDGLESLSSDKTAIDLANTYLIKGGLKGHEGKKPHRPPHNVSNYPNKKVPNHVHPSDENGKPFEYPEHWVNVHGPNIGSYEEPAHWVHGVKPLPNGKPSKKYPYEVTQNKPVVKGPDDPDKLYHVHNRPKYPFENSHEFTGSFHPDYYDESDNWANSVPHPNKAPVKAPPFKRPIKLPSFYRPGDYEHLYSWSQVDRPKPGQRKPFDQWFDQELKAVNNDNEKDFNSSPSVINSLKSIVKKTLQRNGIFIEHHGRVLDVNGSKYPTTNLKIRLIWIGYPLEYQDLIRNQIKNPFRQLYGEKYPKPDAVLVHLLDPPKVLAVIPIHKLFSSIQPKKLSDSFTSAINGGNYGNSHSYPHQNGHFKHNKKQFGDENEHLDSVTNYHDDDDYSSGNEHFSGGSKYFSTGSKYYDSDDDDANHLQEHESFTIQHKIIASEPVVSNVNFHHWGHPDDFESRHAQNSSSEDEETQRNKTVSATTDKPSVKLSLAKGTRKSNSLNRDGNELYENDVIKSGTDDDDDNYDDVPFYRIIGGSSAVGSGLPIASKGRSGDSNDDDDSSPVVE